MLKRRVFGVAACGVVALQGVLVGCGRAGVDAESGVAPSGSDGAGAVSVAGASGQWDWSLWDPESWDDEFRRPVETVLTWDVGEAIRRARSAPEGYDLGHVLVAAAGTDDPKALDLVDDLLRRGVPVAYVSGADGWWPGVDALQAAAALGVPEVVKRLIEAGADPCRVGRVPGEPPLRAGDLIASRGIGPNPCGTELEDSPAPTSSASWQWSDWRRDGVRLEERYPIESVLPDDVEEAVRRVRSAPGEYDLGNALVFAAGVDGPRAVELVDLLIRRGASVDAVREYDDGPDSLDVEFLSKAHVHPDELQRVIGLRRFDALYLAAAWGTPEVVRRLIAAGADPCRSWQAVGESVARRAGDLIASRGIGPNPCGP